MLIFWLEHRGLLQSLFSGQHNPATEKGKGEPFRVLGKSVGVGQMRMVVMEEINGHHTGVTH